MREEVAAMGIDPDERGSRTDECIDALRVIWRAEEPAFDGDHFRFSALRSHPKPVQPTIPILVGGHSRAAARRAGERGDGFFPLGLAGAALDERWQQVQRFAEDAGRDPASIGLTMGGLLGDDGAVQAAIDRGAARVVLSTRTDDLDEIRTQLDAAAGRWVDLSSD
jgi:alkanesulfonate monooxygenase SsuD/methylene tetrahydromethanopterin reductase-like flavin-dependent oxidoreductase (luciferase family)